MSPERNLHRKRYSKISNGVKLAAIVPSAGSGRRMNIKTDKPLIRLCNQELILYSLKILDKCKLISEIVVPTSTKNIKKIKKLIAVAGISKQVKVISGSSHRAGSVKKGLQKLSDDIDFVLVHDCARPFLNNVIIKSTLTAAKKHGASICVVRIKPTIKEVSKQGFIKKTLNRSSLWEAQTPQVFKKTVLLDAYKKAGKSFSSFTDDASLVEATGISVKIVIGSYNNLKITTKEDLIIAERLCQLKLV